MKERKGLCFALVALVFLLIFITGEFKPVEACYGPHITADISRTDVYINESVARALAYEKVFLLNASVSTLVAFCHEKV